MKKQYLRNPLMFIIMLYTMSRRGCCINSPNSFCYICGSFTTVKQRQHINEFMKSAYRAYFGIHLGDQDKPWTSHFVCRSCVENLRQWLQKKRKSLAFGVPMVWREPNDHVSDCYFCLCNVKGYKAKNKSNIHYPNLPSAIRPIPHGPNIPVPDPPLTVHIDEDSQNVGDSTCSTIDSTDIHLPLKQPKLLSQAELNDLVRELDLSKKNAQLLGSRLKEKKLLSCGTTFSWYRYREREFLPFFAKQDFITFCADVQGFSIVLVLCMFHQNGDFLLTVAKAV
jgi:hypothetical protein